jgi:hypothetical protein|nr:MAG TPA: hypothetical protein [Caudoviricetes sp.]
MIKNIILIEEREQNPFFDESKSSNGGGYHQPFEKYSFEYENKKYQLVYDSTSCGDFGSRYTISIYDQDDKTIYDYNVDRVDNREDWLYFSNSFDEKFFNSLINSELKNYIDFHSFEEMEIFLEEQYQN